MTTKEIHAAYPISWIMESPAFSNFMKASLRRGNNDFLIADFASGEHDKVPSFFICILPKLLHVEGAIRKTAVYSIDVHGLRLDSLLGKLEEKDVLARARVVQAKLETMNEEASFRPDMMEYLENHLDDVLWLDDFLIGEKRFPPECFDIGILNNDIVGYMMEYYIEYSDAIIGLSKVHELIIDGGLLVVTMPCALYVVDNITVLRDSGFEYIEGIDIDLKNEHITSIEPGRNPETFSRLGHYTFLVFRK
jgi:hypothetical protein